MRIARHTIVTALLALLLASFFAGPAAAQKYGGILRSMQRANPGSLSTHEEATFVSSWVTMAIYNSVVFYDPLKPIESAETIIPDLARSWSWNRDATALTFKLNQGVKWQDGKPFSGRDIKATFDIVRGVSTQRLKLNPRRLWYTNIKDITTNGDNEVTFQLKRPQPALLMMLGSGYSPVHAAHVPLAKWRTEAMGTGPFRLTEYKRDQLIVTRKNPDYFVKGRPYLEGIDFVIIRSGSTRTAAMISGQLDVSQPTETDQKIYENLKDAVPTMAFNKTYLASNVNVIINAAKPPFNDVRLRAAVNLALDREAYTRAIQPGYLVGGFQTPRPEGSWGLTAEQLRGLPGYRDAAQDKAEARKLMAQLGYSADRPFKVTVTTRQTANYVDAATWMLGELKLIYFDPTLEIVEDGVWHPKVSRRDYAIGLNATGSGIDDPDVTFTENFACDSIRNYSGYCNPALEKLFAKQSETVDGAERLKLSNQIERTLVEETARISLGFRVNYNARYPFVKNFVGHNTNYNWPDWQEVWLDK